MSRGPAQPDAGRAGSSAAVATTVLVAEDEAMIRLDLVEMLDDLGYRVLAAVADGQAAVDRARDLRPDVVLMDIAMPIRDGLSAAEELIADKIAPVVIVTAFAQREVVARASMAGVLGYLVKPFGPADLPPAIDVAIARWRQFADLSAQVAGLRERHSATATVDRAKRALQDRAGMSEPEAFAWLRRRAMDQRVTLAEAAAAVLADPGPAPG